MPNLIETYALQTGLKIDKPIPQEHFYPVPTGKYIVFTSGSGMASKNYDYFNEVIRILQKHLPDYKIVQIGTKEDVPLMDALHLQGQTTIPQMIYIIKHASLLISNDTSAVHIASSYDIPLVALYGATHPTIHGPAFGSIDNQYLLEPDRKGKKPTYSANEAVKTVNQITPEEIARFALKAVGDPTDLCQETVHIGGKYHAITLELVPNQVLSPQEFPNMVINARMDYEFNEGGLFNNLMHRKLCIVTDKPINVEVLKQLRQNVAMVVYILNEDYDAKFIAALRAGGLPYTTIANLEGHALSHAKLDLFDIANVIPRRKIKKTDLENHEKIGNNTLYRSNRFILSNGKIYLNRVALREDKPCLNQRDNEGIVADDPLFWEDVDYFYIYNFK